jgi:hypothetical protein
MVKNKGVMIMAEITFEQCISEMGDSLPGELFIANSLFSSYLTTLPYEEEASAFLRHRDCLHGLEIKVIVVSEQGHSVQRQSDIPVFTGKHHNTLAERERLFTVPGAEDIDFRPIIKLLNWGRPLWF